MTLFYVPLETYRERYTSQLSCPDGWFESKWRRAGIKFERIDGFLPSTGRTIRSGVVLDSVGRSLHCFEQLKHILRRIENGHITKDDVIYFDDFWHPGIEAIRYACDSMGKGRPRMYAYLWAQSVDKYDFTYGMRNWISHYEVGNYTLFDGVFVANSLLKELIEKTWDVNGSKIHVVGLPFDSDEVKSRMFPYPKFKINKVVFSSRWDREKQPDFYMAVAERVLKERQDITFVVTTSSPQFRSNDAVLLQEQEEMKALYPDRFICLNNLTKNDYYMQLCSAKVQFNCALQDWVSFTLLEAATAGCVPVYPNFRSFPETLRDDPLFFYSPWDIQGAADRIMEVIDNDSLHTEFAQSIREWIYRRYDATWKRILHVMHLADFGSLAVSNETLGPYEVVL